MELDNLKRKLETIEKVFDVRKILDLKPDKTYIQKYYKINRLAYTIFHTSTDLIYMGVSRDGIFKESDLLEAVRTVEKYVTSLKASKVLELATGRGANLAYLAKRNPETDFFGVDISEGQLQYARNKAKNIKNYHPEFGDYHDLSKFQNSQFDVVFVVEALCYSENKEKVLAEVCRILKPGGVFIVFDGYRERDEANLTEQEKIAGKLVEKSMAVNHFEPYKEFKTKISFANFEIEKEEDVSEYVLPTMKKFERLAQKFFKFIFLAKLLTLVFPKEFTFNTVAAYLMPTVIKNKIFSYKILVLRKR